MKSVTKVPAYKKIIFNLIAIFLYIICWLCIYIGYLVWRPNEWSSPSGDLSLMLCAMAAMLILWFVVPIAKVLYYKLQPQPKLTFILLWRFLLLWLFVSISLMVYYDVSSPYQRFIKDPLMMAFIMLFLAVFIVNISYRIFYKNRRYKQ
ncbi:MAG: hypothetical protein LBF71_04955 [Campylobacteraceae bacterium]|jgi:hypothetical protein|nr:hypothetical protein [Campylobacteraceae bacterium]